MWSRSGDSRRLQAGGGQAPRCGAGSGWLRSGGHGGARCVRARGSEDRGKCADRFDPLRRY